MTEKPLVSVIINCYNGEKYLREAIDSVIAQTYENWELVFWDNQSTDSTREIVESYCDPRIHYFYAPEHTSLGKARNLAMEKVKGLYLVFLDSDDIWHEVFLEEAVNFLAQDSNSSGFYSNYEMFNASRSTINNPQRKSGYSDFRFFLSHYDVGILCAIVRKDILNKNSIHFDERYSLIEDFDFFLKIVRIQPMYYCEKPLARYRMHEESLSFSQKDGWGKEFRFLLNDLRNLWLSKEECRLYKKELDWLEVRAVYADMNEAIDKDNKKEVLSLISGNWRKSFKLVIGLLYVLIGERRYMNFMNFVRRGNYQA